MQTLKEIQQQEDAQRTRAWKYGIAKNDLASARSRLQALEEQLAAPTPDVTALRQIITLAKEVPSHLTTQGTSLSPGGEEVRGVIERSAQSALSVLAAKRKRLESELPQAKERLAAAEQAFAKFTEAAA